jgi:hypothetical protein
MSIVSEGQERVRHRYFRFGAHARRLFRAGAISQRGEDPQTVKVAIESFIEGLTHEYSGSIGAKRTHSNIELSAYAHFVFPQLFVALPFANASTRGVAARQEC